MYLRVSRVHFDVATYDEMLPLVQQFRCASRDARESERLYWHGPRHRERQCRQHLGHCGACRL
jgi:hypothetical protein